MTEIIKNGIYWWRVLNPDANYNTTIIVCESCKKKRRLPAMNRVFGSSQTCATCGITDKKGEN